MNRCYHECLCGKVHKRRYPQHYVKKCAQCDKPAIHVFSMMSGDSLGTMLHYSQCEEHFQEMIEKYDLETLE